MIYEDTNLAEQERDAWQRGDYEAADLLALALDAGETQADADRLQSIVDGIQERITEANWRTGKKAELRDLVESIVNELAEGAA